jgi:hypothetical protein
LNSVIVVSLISTFGVRFIASKIIELAFVILSDSPFERIKAYVKATLVIVTFEK